MELKHNSNRIKLLDSFRAISILIVILFHFFSRWANLTSYGYTYDYFKFGKLGVQFFFMISGFVIFYTLENTHNLFDFWKKRFIRLLPSMLIASLLTYLVFSIFDATNIFPTSHKFKNVIASITFIQPDILSSLFGRRIDFDYVSGSYWTLWYEIQFYIFISLIYFLNKARFKYNFFIASIPLYLLNLYVDGGWLKSILKQLVFLEAMPFFILGVIYYILFKGISKNRILFFVLLGIVILNLIYPLNVYSYKKVSILIFNFLFILMIYVPKSLSFLENKFINYIGISSYFLYLIHENIGILLINKFGKYFGNYSFLWSIFVIIFLMIIAIFFTLKIERKIGAKLKNILNANSGNM
jgi:peptidoglycan/LPS O-acetylase OafA/YrhL